MYGPTKTAVREKFKQLRDEHDNGINSSASYTVEDAITDWLTRGLNGRSEVTINLNRIYANLHVIPALGKAKLRDLTADDVDDWLQKKKLILATSTLKSCLGVLRRAIAQAQQRNKVLRNVAELVTAPEGRSGRRSKSLSLEEAQAVMKASKKTSIYGYVILSLLTGIRTEEARALTWDHVHLDGLDGVPPHVEVWRSVRRKGDTKTPKSRRTLALPEVAVDALKAQKMKQQEERQRAGTMWQESNLVFSTRFGTRLNAANVRRSLRIALKKAGIIGSWTPRELRHSFVSLMSAHGAPIELISQLVGHTDTRTTETVYRHELRPVITEGAEIMGKLFFYE